MEEGERSIRAVAADAESQNEAILALAFLLGGIGEYQAMVDDLAKVAPDEIRPEMERARDSFQRQSSAAAGAGPATELTVGAMGALIDGLANRTAFEAVDVFALDNCGSAVFSLSAAGVTTDTDTDTEGVQAAPEEDSCPGLPYLTDAAPGGDLEDALSVARALGVEGLQDLANVAGSLEPEAYTVLEAVARIGWEDGGERLAERINVAVEETCGRPLIAEDTIQKLSVTGPRKVEPGQFLLGAYDPSCTSNRFSFDSQQDLLHSAYNGTHVLVWPCNFAPVVLSLEDGTPLHLNLGDQFDIVDDSRRRPALTANYVFWTLSEEVAPTGLEAAGEAQMLFRRDLSPPYGVVELRREDSDTGLWLLDTAGQHVLIQVGEEILVLHEDGRELLTAPSADFGPTHLLDGIWFTGVPGGPLVDVRTASLVDVPRSDESASESSMHRVGRPDRCAPRTVVEDRGWNQTWMLHRTPDASIDIRLITADGNWLDPLPAATVRGDPGPFVYDLDGELIWEPPVARRSAVFGEKLYAEAEDGTIFEVDAFNDQLLSPTLDQEILEALFDIQTIHVHRETGDVVLFRHSITGRDSDGLLRLREGACSPKSDEQPG